MYILFHHGKHLSPRVNIPSYISILQLYQYLCQEGDQTQGPDHEEQVEGGLHVVEGDRCYGRWVLVVDNVTGQDGLLLIPDPRPPLPLVDQPSLDTINQSINQSTGQSQNKQSWLNFVKVDIFIIMIYLLILAVF